MTWAGSAPTLVTGGAGFIGSAVVREPPRRTEGFVIVRFARTCAGGRDDLPDDPRVALVQGDAKASFRSLGLRWRARLA